MLEVIGFEGRGEGEPLLWGAAAVRTDKGIINAVLGGPPMSEEEWQEIVNKGSATQIETPIPLKKLSPLFTMSLRLDLLKRKPYSVGNVPEIYGVVGVSRGKIRGYYAFENHKRLTTWLYHLHAGNYELIPAR